MEWLSSEEKSRSMMPYLLDLPPLDNNDNTVKIKEITDVKDEVKIKTKNASKKKTSVQDIEVEK